ncbi:MAG: LuxR C-terminal-related transcriptional regulator [Pseudomonadota bacterium]
MRDIGVVSTAALKEKFSNCEACLKKSNTIYLDGWSLHQLALFHGISILGSVPTEVFLRKPSTFIKAGSCDTLHDPLQTLETLNLITRCGAKDRISLSLTGLEKSFQWKEILNYYAQIWLEYRNVFRSLIDVFLFNHSDNFESQLNACQLCAELQDWPQVLNIFSELAQGSYSAAELKTQMDKLNYILEKIPEFLHESASVQGLRILLMARNTIQASMSTQALNVNKLHRIQRLRPLARPHKISSNTLHTHLNSLKNNSLKTSSKSVFHSSMSLNNHDKKTTDTRLAETHQSTEFIHSVVSPTLEPVIHLNQHQISTLRKVTSRFLAQSLGQDQRLDILELNLCSLFHSCRIDNNIHREWHDVLAQQNQMPPIIAELLILLDDLLHIEIQGDADVARNNIQRRTNVNITQSKTNRFVMHYVRHRAFLCLGEWKHAETELEFTESYAFSLPNTLQTFIFPIQPLLFQICWTQSQINDGLSLIYHTHADLRIGSSVLTLDDKIQQACLDYLVRNEKNAFKTLEQWWQDISHKKLLPLHLKILVAIAYFLNFDKKNYKKILFDVLAQLNQQNNYYLLCRFGFPIAYMIEEMLLDHSDNSELLEARATLATMPWYEKINILLLSLTKREIEIINLLREGFTNEDISNVLVRSVGTIKLHIHNIYKKLEARNRIQAIQMIDHAGFFGFRFHLPNAQILPVMNKF